MSVILKHTGRYSNAYIDEFCVNLVTDLFELVRIPEDTDSSLFVIAVAKKMN